MSNDNQSGFLSEVTRKHRTSLLLACLIGFSISKVGFYVTKVSLLGSELTLTRIDAIPLILGLVVIYYFLTFVSYGFDDYVTSLHSSRAKIVDNIKSGNWSSPDQLVENLQKLKEQLIEVENQLEQTEGFGERLAIQQLVTEKKKQVEIAENLAAFYSIKPPTFFERLKTSGLRAFMELFAPILIGIYTIALLFFFTPTPQISPTLGNCEDQLISNCTDATTNSKE